MLRTVALQTLHGEFVFAHGLIAIKVSRYIFGLPFVATIGCVAGFLFIGSGHADWLLLLIGALLTSSLIGMVDQKRHPDALMIDAPSGYAPSERLLVKSGAMQLRAFVLEAARDGMTIQIHERTRRKEPWSIAAMSILEQERVDYEIIKAEYRGLLAVPGPDYKTIPGSTVEELIEKIQHEQVLGQQCAGDIKTRTEDGEEQSTQKMLKGKS